jgi:hypothetical protein
VGVGVGGGVKVFVIVDEADGVVEAESVAEGLGETDEDALLVGVGQGRQSEQPPALPKKL